MKEKRVDIYLAKAGFAQVIATAIAGWTISQVFDKKWNELQTYSGGIATIILSIIISRYYRKARLLTKSRKRDI